ncbi:MAG: response regulator transcription factor [Pirellulales bacterium]|nr:response regulator transcription factor [Pirellulales bacterium]
MAVRLLVADDHPLVRAGLRQMIVGTEFEITAEASSGEDVLRALDTREFDCVLLDVRMRPGDGLSTLAKLRTYRADLPVVVISSHYNPTYIAKAVALGANGFFHKLRSRNELLDVIRACSNGGSAWTRSELRRVSGGIAAPKVATSIDYALTRREMEVLGKIADGFSNNAIAEALAISRETVKEHVQNLLRKLGLSDRTQAAVWAVRNGLA